MSTFLEQGEHVGGGSAIKGVAPALTIARRLWRSYSRTTCCLGTPGRHGIAGIEIWTSSSSRSMVSCSRFPRQTPAAVMYGQDLFTDPSALAEARPPRCSKLKTQVVGSSADTEGLRTHRF